MSWTGDELDRIGDADELEVAAARATTLRLVPEEEA
jgi:hypothetical protein